jgi:sulfur-oxidizing protein SoxX
MVGSYGPVFAISILTAQGFAPVNAWAETPAGPEAPPLAVSRPADPANGRKIVADRRRGMCLLCHSGPFPEERFQGNLAPSLVGAGARWNEGQLRFRLIDSARINPETIMPPYFRAQEKNRVGRAFASRTILSAEEIEDVTAYLSTLRD